MIHKTTDYSIFTYRIDNRDNSKYPDGIDPDHVAKLVTSIKKKNMLNSNPIVVNERLEIIDGQHRTKAAEKLGVPIYYIINKILEPEDMIALNTTHKNWTLADYLYFWRMNNKEHYQRLHNFMVKYDLPIRVALLLTKGNEGVGLERFRKGFFEFDTEISTTHLEFCVETIMRLRQYRGKLRCFENSRFWYSLIKIVSHPKFNIDHWLTNVEKLSNRFISRANQSDYTSDMVYVYNHCLRTNKINFKDDDNG